LHDQLFFKALLSNKKDMTANVEVEAVSSMFCQSKINKEVKESRII